jgi:hypothetical protein
MGQPATGVKADQMPERKKPKQKFILPAGGALGIDRRVAEVFLAQIEVWSRAALSESALVRFRRFFCPGRGGSPRRAAARSRRPPARLHTSDRRKPGEDSLESKRPTGRAPERSKFPDRVARAEDARDLGGGELVQKSAAHGANVAASAGRSRRPRPYWLARGELAEPGVGCAADCMILSKACRTGLGIVVGAHQLICLSGGKQIGAHRIP